MEFAPPAWPVWLPAAQRQPVLRGKTRDDTWDRFPSWKRFKGGVMLEADWNGGIVWEHTDKEHHHDARRTPSGGALYMTVELMDPGTGGQGEGRRTRTDAEGMWADVLVEVDSAGNRVWEWHAAEHLDPDARNYIQ